MLRKLTVTIALVLAVCAFAAPIQDNAAKLKSALAWLHKVEPEFSPDVKAMVPAIESVLERYYNDPETLRQSERDLAEAFLNTMPATDDSLGGRGSSEERMKDFESLLGSTSKKTTPPKKSAPKPPVHTPPKHRLKLPGITTRPAFTAVQKVAPGGKKIGAVLVSIDGRKKTVVEIFSTTPGYSLQRRASVIATRMKNLSAKNPLWWTTVKPGATNGEAVVRASGAPILVTADKAYAAECGMTPTQLARQLAVKIRTTFDANSGDEFGGRALTPDQMREGAIDLRQDGDDLYATAPAQAEEKYKAAIVNDPTYHVPYLRLADLYLSRHKPDEAKAIVTQGLQVEGITGSQRSELEAKLTSLGQ